MISTMTADEKVLIKPISEYFDTNCCLICSHNYVSLTMRLVLVTTNKGIINRLSKAYEQKKKCSFEQITISNLLSTESQLTIT